MELNPKRAFSDRMEPDTLFSKTVKAGKRIYYFDLKKNRNDDLFLTITESRKIVKGTPENPIFEFEKHKLFVYKEDFHKMMVAMTEAMQYVEELTGQSLESMNRVPSEPIFLGDEGGGITLDIPDFE